MAHEVISLTVIGKPEPRGSKITVPLYDDLLDEAGNVVIDEKSGKPQKKARLDASGRPMSFVRDDNSASYGWMKKVAGAARRAFGNRQPFDGPLKLYMRFYLERPQYHFGTGRNAGVLKERWAHVRHIVRPDRLKLARAIEDACAEILYVDDAQTVGGEVEKFYVTPGEQPRVEIEMHLPGVRQPNEQQRRLIEQ